MKRNYFFSVFTAFIVLLCLSCNTVQAQDWSWQIDNSLFSPNLVPELENIGTWFAQGLYDLSGNSQPETILLNDSQDGAVLNLIEMDGEFPNICWRLSPDFFPAIEFEPDTRINFMNFYDLDEDDAVEIVLNGQFVLKNFGDFDNPDWRRADDLIPDFDAGSSIPQICDWDNDGFLDIIAATYPVSPDSMWTNQGFYRYEINDDGGWDSLGYTEIDMGLLQNIADLDQDGDLDIIASAGIIYTYGAPPRDYANYFTNGIQILFNEGTPDEPIWSRPVLNEDLYSPTPCDLNNDGFIDLVAGWRYCLNMADEDAVVWDRMVSWRNRSGTIYAATDFVGDEQVEFLRGKVYSTCFMDHRFRLIQEELTPAGWRDAQFFGDDFADWASGFTDLWAIRTGDFLGNGQTQIALAKSIGMGQDESFITLYTDQDDGEGWDWQPVNGFFNGLVDPDIYVFKPAFGDFDRDGDLDCALMQENSADSFLIHFFEYLPEENERWIPRPDWGCAIFDTLQVRSLGSGDFDGDGACDLITVGNGNLVLRVFCNVSQDDVPDWIFASEALTNGGPEQAYEVVVADVNLDGKLDLLAGSSLFLNQTTSAVAEADALPLEFSLSSPYPNPFNSTTTIGYSLPAAGVISLAVYDLSGREVARIADGVMPAGTHEAVWVADGMASGVYVVRLVAGGISVREKVVLVR